MNRYGVGIALLFVVVANFWALPAQAADSKECHCPKLTAALAVSELQLHLERLQRHAEKAVDGEGQAYRLLRAERDSAHEHFEQVKQLDFDVARLGLEAQRSLRYVEEIQKSQMAVLEAIGAASNARTKLTIVAAKGDLLTEALSNAGSSPAQIHFAGRLQVITFRIQRQIHELMNGRKVAQAANRLGRSMPLLSQVIDTLLAGSEELGIESVEDPNVLEVLGEIHEIVETVDNNVVDLLDLAFDLKTVRSAKGSFEAAVRKIQERSEQLKTELRSATGDA